MTRRHTLYKIPTTRRQFIFKSDFPLIYLTRLSNKLLEQGYVKERLKSPLRKFYGRYRDLIKQYEVSLSQMLNDILWPDHIQWQPPTDQTLYRTQPLNRILSGFHRTFGRVWHADRDAYSSGHLVLSHFGLAYVLCWDYMLLYQFMPLSLTWLFTEYTWSICKWANVYLIKAYLKYTPSILWWSIHLLICI